MIQDKLDREVEQLIVQELTTQPSFVSKKPEQDVTRAQFVDLLAKLDVLQTYPLNKKARQKQTQLQQQRAQAEKEFVAALWDDFFEITKPKADDSKGKKTPRKNWDLKRDTPVASVVVQETLKVLVNPYLGQTEKTQLLSDI